MSLGLECRATKNSVRFLVFLKEDKYEQDYVFLL